MKYFEYGEKIPQRFNCWMFLTKLKIIEPTCFIAVLVFLIGIKDN